MVESTRKPVTYADLEAVPPHLVAEIIDGELVTRPVGVPLEAMVRTALAVVLARGCEENAFSSKRLLILSNAELHVGAQVLVPEIACWSKDAIAPWADASHTEAVPEWLCEVRSPHTSSDVARAKRSIYAAAGIPHLWSIDPHNRTLHTFALRHREWTLLGKFGRGDMVSTAPFNELTFPLADLWPLDPSTTRQHVN